MKSALLPAILIATTPLCPAVTTVFSTGEFTPSEWTGSLSTSSDGTATASTPLSGGNPGAYLRMNLSVAPFQHVAMRQLWNVAQFNPGSQGAITSVSFEYDISRVATTNLSALQVSKRFAVEQDGAIHTAFFGVTTVSPPTWEHVSVPDIVPLFPAVDWTNGNTITFGVESSVSTSGIGFTISSGHDNFAVTVNSVPEPGTAVLALLTSAAFLRRRR